MTLCLPKTGDVTKRNGIRNGCHTSMRRWALDRRSHLHPGNQMVIQGAKVDMWISDSVLRREYKHFDGMLFHEGKCNVCGSETRFFYNEPTLYRESLVCGECL